MSSLQRQGSFLTLAKADTPGKSPPATCLCSETVCLNPCQLPVNTPPTLTSLYTASVSQQEKTNRHLIITVSKYLFGDASKEAIIDIPQGQLYLVRPLSPKGYSELIFKDAVATIRRTGQEFQYQLVVQRAYAAQGARQAPTRRRPLCHTLHPRSVLELHVLPPGSD